MTVTPTRLPGVRAARARVAAGLLDALAHGVSGPSMVAAVSVCAAGVTVALGATGAQL